MKFILSSKGDRNVFMPITIWNEARTLYSGFIHYKSNIQESNSIHSFQKLGVLSRNTNTLVINMFYPMLSENGLKDSEFSN